MGVWYSLVTVSVLVHIAALRHHGLFVQGERQLQLKQKTQLCQKADKLNNVDLVCMQYCYDTFSGILPYFKMSTFQTFKIYKLSN